MNTTTIILLGLLLVGIAIILLQFKLSNDKCPPDRVIYKYVPRTFKEEQRDPVKVSDIFRDMFEKPNVKYV